MLFQHLSAIHPAIAVTLVCIDASGSFVATLPSVLPRVTELLDDCEQEILDEFVCFAGTAVRKNHLRSWLADPTESHTASSLGIGAGTNASPLIDAVNAAVRDSDVTRVVLVTDGAFDIPLDSVLHKLHDEMQLEVLVMPS
jgi:hypothetical protein